MADRSRTLPTRGRGKKGKVERRRAKRLIQSTEIAFARAEPIIHAAIHAKRTGRPLNRFVTIAFGDGLCPLRASEALGKFLKSAGDWLRWHDAPVAFVWTIEHPPGKSEHAHLLIHVPEVLKADFSRLQRGWITRTRTYWAKGVVHSEPVGETDAALVGVLRYMLKGGDAETRQALGIDYFGPQGRVDGKRCGMSNSLGASARARENGPLGPSERPTAGKGRSSGDLTKPDTGAPSEAAE